MHLNNINFPHSRGTSLRGTSYVYEDRLMGGTLPVSPREMASSRRVELNPDYTKPTLSPTMQN